MNPKHTRQYKYAKRNREKISKWQKEYRKKNKKHIAQYYKEFSKSASGIFSTIKHRVKTENKKDYLRISREDFIEWFNLQPKKCYYCDIPENLISDKWCKQSKRLQVDRVDSDKVYELGNIVLACPVCNSFKSDIFSGEEAREIAQKYIKPKWKEF